MFACSTCPELNVKSEALKSESQFVFYFVINSNSVKIIV